MLMRGFKLSVVLLVAVTFSSCSWFRDPYVRSGTAGGIVGAGIGAGTGAIIAHNIARGKVAASTLLGAGIGLPVGILAGVMIQSYAEKREIDRNNEVIMANYRYISSRQKQIDDARELLVEESIAITPNKELRGEIYTGPTIGVYNR